MSNKQTGKNRNDVETFMREHFEDVVKGKQPPHDDFEKHLGEATKIRNKVANGKSENPSSDLDEAQRHLEEARKHLPNSDLRDDFCNILDSTETEINQLKKRIIYDEIMAALLQAYEAHPEMDVEEIIAQVAREMGANDKSLENIKASSAMLDKFQEKKTALEAAHEEGETTKKWLLTETARMTENRTDEEKAIITDAIVETVNRGVKQSLTEGQNSKEE